MARKASSGGRRGSQKDELDKRQGIVKSKVPKSASFYGRCGKKHTLSGRAQKVLSTVLEDMIEDTLENARRLAQGTGKNKVAIEDVEMAMVNLCQRLQPRSNPRADEIPVEYDPPQISQNKNRQHHLKSPDSQRAL